MELISDALQLTRTVIVEKQVNERMESKVKWILKWIAEFDLKEATRRFVWFVVFTSPSAIQSYR